MVATRTISTTMIPTQPKIVRQGWYANDARQRARAPVERRSCAESLCCATWCSSSVVGAVNGAWAPSAARYTMDVQIMEAVNVDDYH